jgi:hypothetical protein
MGFYPNPAPPSRGGNKDEDFLKVLPGKLYAHLAAQSATHLLRAGTL